MLEAVKVRVKRLGQVLRRVARRSGTLRQIHRRLVGKRQQARFEISELHARLGGARDVNPGNMIWIFGSGRNRWSAGSSAISIPGPRRRTCVRRTSSWGTRSAKDG